MRPLFTQLSGLTGLFALLNQLLTHAPIGRAVFIGVTTGLSVYLLLLVGDLSIQRILAMAPDEPADAAHDDAEAASERTAETAARPVTAAPEALAA